MSETIGFQTAEGHQLSLTLYGVELAADTPCVIYNHGFKGFKDWGFAPPTGEFFAAAGIRFLAMNFSHNGIGEQPLDFTELDKFRANTFSLELSESRQVIQAYRHGELFGDTRQARLGLIGHSRGGGIAVLSGSSSPELSAVCTWAAVSDFARYPEEMLTLWKEQGYIDIPNSRTGQIMQIGYGLHEDLMAHREDKLNIEKAARNIGKPLCVVHGEADPVVLPSCAEDLRNWAGDCCQDFLLVPGGDHTFGGKHPWQGSNPGLDQVWQVSLDFFKRHLQA